jgi:hypothetical protein
MAAIVKAPSGKGESKARARIHKVKTVPKTTKIKERDDIFTERFNNLLFII